MASDIKSILQGKRILILGFGREGQSTYELLRSYFPDAGLAIADRDEALLEKYPQLDADSKLVVMTGKAYLDSCSSYDLVIKSPGIPFKQIEKHCDGGRITSQTDLFLRAYSGRVIGVTGTKGKSTTATLIHHMLTLAGRKAVLAGNIGIPPLSLASDIEDDTEVIFEMSSHQLEHISIAPQIAVILNIYPEHLDHYKDFTAYKMAKFNISLMQADGGTLIYNADDPYIKEFVGGNAKGKTKQAFTLKADKNIAARIDGSNIVVIDKDEQEKLFPLNSATDLPGRHNNMNMMAAILVCLDKGLSTDEIIHGISSYKRLEHRLEYAGTFRGISFYNDSIATIPEACIEAMRTLDHVDLLILGGYDRGLDYEVLLQRLLSHPVPYIVFMGDAGARMYDEWKEALSSNCECVIVNGMEEAFNFIKKTLADGSVCLLSPAAASYGMFANFEERGGLFKKMAADL